MWKGTVNRALQQFCLKYKFFFLTFIIFFYCSYTSSYKTTVLTVYIVIKLPQSLIEPLAVKEKGIVIVQNITLLLYLEGKCPAAALISFPMSPYHTNSTKSSAILYLVFSCCSSSNFSLNIFTSFFD